MIRSRVRSTRERRRPRGSQSDRQPGRWTEQTDGEINKAERCDQVQHTHKEMDKRSSRANANSESEERKELADFKKKRQIEDAWRRFRRVTRDSAGVEQHHRHQQEEKTRQSTRNKATAQLPRSSSSKRGQIARESKRAQIIRIIGQKNSVSRRLTSDFASFNKSFI